MPNYSVAEAKNSLPILLDRAIAGEEVVITRRGAVIAEIRPKRPEVPGDDTIYERLQQLRESQSPLPISGVDLIRQIRDEGY